jgi:hypothetical protein
MILRSNKQTTPVLKLIITENKNKTKKKTEKKALKRNQNSIYKYLKKRYKIRKNNAIIPF